MKGYRLDERLQTLSGCRLTAENKPLVGITANLSDGDATLRERYYLQVEAAGGAPVILPPLSGDSIFAWLDNLDALILSGGGDCDPHWQGEEKLAVAGKIKPQRDESELLLARLARERSMPLLGICRGIQMMAVAFGGHVAQDISLDAAWQKEKGFCHSQKAPRDVKTHKIIIEKQSNLHDIYNCNSLSVNSFHHQVVDCPPEDFHVVARSEDGIIEAMESAEHKPAMGIQWHPEWLGEEGGKIFEWLVGEAAVYKRAKALHKTIITLDSHCDTPMFFPQGADFTRRDEKIKVDLEKMTDGMLDVATMAAYVPQPINNEVWSDVAPIAAPTPFDYANLIFDRTEALVKSSKLPVAIARTPGEAVDNKRAGRKSIMLAVENALALGNDIKRVGHFKKRGAVYFTLCHNGDNQICDSARRSIGTWRGLSPFGEKVVAEMNRQGVMIDLSHAAESTFRDVLELSKKPVVCSHSNCRALCNHERNLTDEQLRLLAAKDGVCQLTLYAGFVCENPSEADILHFVEHVEHAAQLIGTEHIGIGSDFDGDGGIRGLNDASEMTLFTRQLLRKRFSDDDIRLIWGGNWLRVMTRNQENNC
ncbi:MAG: membrane dipeptidase [Prevotella sp.]|nr:membrane dipeptidase [Prevotella sp.]